VEGDTLAVVAPGQLAVLALARGQHAHRARGEIVVEDLRLFVAALVAQECEAGSHRRLRRARRGHGLAEERELLARAQWRGDAMQLLGVAEARGDQQGIIRQPVDETGAARVQVIVEPRGEWCVHARYIVEHQVAAFLDGGVRHCRDARGQDCQE
jgi:hypothetical protein